MEIRVEENFFRELVFCPAWFQQEFRKVYQQLRIVDRPQEIKGIFKIERNLYKIQISKSRIALRITGSKGVIGCFLYNEFHKSG
jgi:hypothetical protein